MSAQRLKNGASLILSGQRCAAFSLPFRLPLPSLCGAAPAIAADAPGKGDDKAKIELPPMSPDKSIEQSINLDGHALRYKATVGHIDVHDDKGKTIGQVVYTAYTVACRPLFPPGDLRLQRRPRRFLGLPQHGRDRARRRSVSESRATAPSDPAVLHDNPEQLARLHRPRLHRSGRHRLLAQPRGRRRDQEGLLRRQDRHRVSEPRRLRLAGQERPDDQPQISRSAKATAASACPSWLIICRARWASAFTAW